MILHKLKIVGRRVSLTSFLYIVYIIYIYSFDQGLQADEGGWDGGGDVAIS